MSRVFEPHTLTIITTNACTARCRHCSARSAPGRTETLSAAQMTSALAQAFDELELRVVAFAGGEPLLLVGDLLETIAFCERHGVPTRVVTNAYWAATSGSARQIVSRLRQAGLRELNISTDDYHLPYVSLQRVRYAYEAALDAGFESVTILSTFGSESWLTPEQLAMGLGAGRDLPIRVEGDEVRGHRAPAGETSLLLSNRPLLPVGRGADELGTSDVGSPGAGAFPGDIGGCPSALRSAALSPRGHLLACCGIEAEGNPILDYGDLSEHTLPALLDRADGDLIGNMIAVLGPPRICRLMDRIAPGELALPRARYHGYCDLCEDLVCIPANRETLYRNQGAFAGVVLMVREAYTRQYLCSDGRVRVPAGGGLDLVFSEQG